jgi:hypothetical protein
MIMRMFATLDKANPDTESEGCSLYTTECENCTLMGLCPRGIVGTGLKVGAGDCSHRGCGHSTQRVVVTFPKGWSILHTTLRI